MGGSHYPGGYRASVDGGTILSKHNANLLKVAARKGRPNVAISVRPAGSGARNHVDCRVAKHRRKHRR